MDALSSFTFLAENLPSWIDELNNLGAYTSEKQKEFAAEFSQLAKTRPAPSRHGSTTSIRNNDDSQPLDLSPKAATDTNQSQYAPLDFATKQVFATARRKRKPPTHSARSGASGPQRFRTRHMVVVWYDSTVQEGFESLVRNIAGARNNLRKGKMSAIMKNGFQLPPFRTPTPQTGSTIMTTLGEPKNGMRSQILMPIGKPSATPSPGSDSAESPFDRADKELEGAQSLCEVAAHQFLRDADCQLELDSIKKRFEAALAIGRLEREKLEEERMNELRDEVEDPIKEEQPFSTEDVTTVPPLKSLHSVPLDATAIEVDDDSDAESIEIDISAFRAARIGMRGRIPIA